MIPTMAAVTISSSSSSKMHEIDSDISEIITFKARMRNASFRKL